MPQQPFIPKTQSVSPNKDPKLIRKTNAITTTSLSTASFENTASSWEIGSIVAEVIGGVCVLVLLVWFSISRRRRRDAQNTFRSKRYWGRRELPEGNSTSETEYGGRLQYQDRARDRNVYGPPDKEMDGQKTEAE